MVDEKIDRKIQEQVSMRNLNRGLLPPDAENYVGLIDSLLRQCLGRPAAYGLCSVEMPVIKKPGPKPAHHRIILTQTAGPATAQRLGLTVVTTDNATSAAGFLRRLRDASRPPEQSLLVTDERQPLRLAKTGSEYLAELQRGGTWPRFELLVLPFAEIAQLDALQAVVAQGKAGDIEVDLPDGSTISVDDTMVIESHHRQNRYKGCPLLERLLGNGTASAPPSPPRLEVEAVGEFVMAQLALTMGMLTRGLASKFASEHDLPQENRVALHAAIVAVATQLHEQSLLNATPTEDGLFLLLK